MPILYEDEMKRGTCMSCFSPTTVWCFLVFCPGVLGSADISVDKDGLIVNQLLLQILVLCGCRPVVMAWTQLWFSYVCFVQFKCATFFRMLHFLMFFPFWWHNEPERAMAETCLFLKNHVWWTCVSLFVCLFVCLFVSYFPLTQQTVITCFTLATMVRVTWCAGRGGVEVSGGAESHDVQLLGACAAATLEGRRVRGSDGDGVEGRWGVVKWWCHGVNCDLVGKTMP